jgi:drug/metabolite transporter (DMT)-like permease
LALYLAMQRGAVSLAAPVSAVLAAVIPVVVSASSEGLPRPVQLGGFGVAFLAIILISRPAGARLGQLDWRGLGLPMLAGLGFGFFLVFLNRASAEAVFYPSVISRLASLAFQAALAARQGAGLAVPRRLWPLIVFAGALTAAGNVSFSAAGQVGRLDITSVLASLYPAATVGLAWLVLKERLRPSQAWGIGAALLAILLIAWPV